MLSLPPAAFFANFVNVVAICPLIASFILLVVSLKPVNQAHTPAPLLVRSKTQKRARRSNDPGSGRKGRSSIEAYDDRTIDREARASKWGSAWSRK